MDVQYGRLRLLPPLVFAGYLLLGWIFGKSSDDWRVVAFVAVVLLVGGGRWPLPVALGEAVLLAVASFVSDAAVAGISTLASLALLELAIRRPLRQAAVGALVLAAAYFVVAYFVARSYGFGMDVAYGKALGIVVGGYVLGGGVAIPLLLGAWLRLVLIRKKERHLRDLRSARQAERTEIARDLHDLVAHHVASMALRVGVARAVVPDLDPRVRAVLDDVHGSAATTLADLRRLVGVLRDPSTGESGSRLVHVDPDDLPAAVSEVIDRNVRAGLEVDGHVDPAIATLDSVRGLAVLRLVQEGLTNVAKHAAGARATVRVEILDGSLGGTVRVDVTDDGGAPNRQPPLPATASGYGLIGLRERVSVIGGTLTAGALGGRRRGWRLRATLPVTEEDRCAHGLEQP